MSVKKRGELSNGLPPDELSGGGDHQPRPNGLDRATELALLDTALLGDMQAFSDVFEHYRPALYTLCCRRLNDDSLAEDVVQEAFLKAFESLSSSDHRKPIWPWLATIASRLCIDLQRRRSFTHYSADIGVFMDAEEDQAELAIDQVIASEDRAEFWKSLDVLPERQRRVLMLYAVEGLSGAEIASVEGISAAAVRRLLFRARRKMWASRQSGPLPAIVFPFNWLRWKLQQIEERVHPFLGYSEGFSAACVHAVCLTVAVMVVAAGSPAEPLRGEDVTTGEAFAPAAQTRPPQTVWPRTVLPNIGASSTAPVEPQRSVADPANSLVDEVINPNQNATPESTYFYSVTPSPNYESDQTILAAGRYSNPAGQTTPVLFGSQDGGATWKPRPSRFLNGSTLVLPPDFPQDGRIFVSGGILGLQQSDDGGEIFKTVSPVSGGSAAISPLFGKGDPKILMSGKTVLEYDAGTGVTRPALPVLPPANQGYSSIAFSPNYQSDSTIFVAEAWGGASYRCRGLLCDAMPLPTAEPLTFRFSPECGQAGLAYVFTPWKLLVSHDQARTFEKVEFPFDFQPPFFASRSFLDVATLCNKFSDPAIFTSFIDDSSLYPQLPSGIYRSFDAGRSWNRTSIDLPGFHAGAASKLIITPTGRLLATGVLSGIACSVDRGETWNSRCPPEL